MKKVLLILLVTLNIVQAKERTQWVPIGSGTYQSGFVYPYKIQLSVPVGVRNIDEIKEGLLPMKFNLEWLLINSPQKDVRKLFLKQLTDSYTNKEGYKLSKHIIGFFIEKLPAIQKHDEWVFTYYPDEGFKLYIDIKKIHILVGAELNRALIQSWFSNSPILTNSLFKRLLKVQNK